MKRFLEGFLEIVSLSFLGEIDTGLAPESLGATLGIFILVVAFLGSLYLGVSLYFSIKERLFK